MPLVSDTRAAPICSYSEIILDFTPDAFLILFFIALTQTQPTTLSSSVFKHLLSGILPIPTTIKPILEWFEYLRYSAQNRNYRAYLSPFIFCKHDQRRAALMGLHQYAGGFLSIREITCPTSPQIIITGIWTLLLNSDRINFLKRVCLRTFL